MAIRTLKRTSTGMWVEFCQRFYEGRKATRMYGGEPARVYLDVKRAKKNVPLLREGWIALHVYEVYHAARVACLSCPFELSSLSIEVPPVRCHHSEDLSQLDDLSAMAIVESPRTCPDPCKQRVHQKYREGR